jgi:hypothetical protein
LKIDLTIVLHPADGVGSGTIHPGVIVPIGKHPRLPGGRISADQRTCDGSDPSSAEPRMMLSTVSAKLSAGRA